MPRPSRLERDLARAGRGAVDNRYRESGTAAAMMLNDLMCGGAAVTHDGMNLSINGTITSFWRVFSALRGMSRMGATLHRRYEAECSHAWADNDGFRTGTAMLEARIVAMGGALGLSVEFCTDPRGRPVRIAVDPNHSNFTAL